MNFKPLLQSHSQPKTGVPTWLYAHLFLLLVYLILAMALTWPTITHLTTHLPGDGGDDPAIAWNLWWVKYALLNAGQNPFSTDFMFYPVGINLAFYTLTVLNAVTALPFTLNYGAVAASNLHLLFTFVAGAYGTFLLTRYVLIVTTTASSGKFRADHHPPPPELSTVAQPPIVDGLIWLSAAIAGGFYAFASNKLFYVALGQFNIASNHWIPLAGLFVIRTGRNPHRLKNAVMAGLFLTFQTWTEMTYASFMLVFIGLYWLYGLIVYLTRFMRKWPRPTFLARPSPLPHLRAAIVLLCIFAAGISPIILQMIPDMLTEGDFFVEGSGFAESFSADVLGFVIPTMRHPVLGRWISQTGVQNFSLGQHIYLGIVLSGLLLVSLFTGYRYPQIRFWLTTAAIFALLCLGPVITVNGQSTGISGPFVLLQNLPFFKGNRYPSRYSVMLILSLSVLAGFALAQIGERLKKRQFTIHHLFLLLILLLFLFEHLSLPLPQSDTSLPSAYRLINADPGDFTVLDIPFAWRNGFRIIGAYTTQFMFGQFYQTSHQKRMLQGNTSRNPEFKFQYFTRAPVINSLLALETGKTLPPAQWDADRAIAGDVLRFFNIHYIVVRPETFNKFGHYPQATIPYLEDVLPVENIHNETAIKIYRVEQTTDQETRFPSNLLINTDTPLAPLYFGEGWGLLTPGQPILAQRKEVGLLLPLSGKPQRLTLRLRLPESAPAGQTVGLTLNNWYWSPQPIGPGWQEISFRLPAGIPAGLNNFRLHFSDVSAFPPLKPNQPPLDVTVLSAGQEVGDFGHIFVNGHEVSPNQRGYNVALIRADGTVRPASFDTHLDPATSIDLADFINTAPPDILIAVAAADEASANLSEDAVQALQSIGAAGDLRGCFRCSHAIIGQPGQVRGTAIEALDALRPVGVTTGLGLTEPTIAAQIAWIKVEPVEE
ncbi:MAG: hypothetical protein JXM69_08805 [Anaerolineae bacterium]|nr:hypothetical protein [Anaerolineae bacterium]